jgi:hypothetical protein
MDWLRRHDQYEDLPLIPVGGLSRPKGSPLRD